MRKPTAADATESDVVLDLSGVAQGERVGIWERWVPATFPGVSVSYAEGKDPSGLVRLIDLGQARFWSILSTYHTVRNDPEKMKGRSAAVAAIVQQSGRTRIAQDYPACHLTRGDICILDSTRPFTIESLGMSQSLVCVIPRALVETRYPGILQRSGVRLEGHEPIGRMLWDLVAIITEHHLHIAPDGRTAVLSAFLSLLAGLPMASSEAQSEPHWRVRKALDEIDKAIEDPQLDAAMIARRQNISRRRLDQLFSSELGSTLAAQILERRLMHAASALCDTSQEFRQVTDIAFAAGFKDGAHFSRAFRRRFESTPREWRRAALQKAPPPGRPT